MRYAVSLRVCASVVFDVECQRDAILFVIDMSADAVTRHAACCRALHRRRSAAWRYGMRGVDDATI